MSRYPDFSNKAGLQNISKQAALEAAKKKLLKMSKEEFQAELEKHKDGDIAKLIREIQKIRE